MRRAVIRRTCAAAGVLALVGGCTVQTVGPDGRPYGSASGGAATAPSASAPARGQTTGGGNPSGPGTSAAPPARTLFAPGDRGERVRELQARLREVAWLRIGPTGTYDALTTAAVSGFQGKRGLPRTGTTDSVTWQRLLTMTHEPTRDELYATGGRPPAKPDPRCMTGRALCISKTSRTVSWMVDGKRLMTTDVRFGSQYSPTREGVFHVYWKSRHHVSTIYHAPMPYAMFFSGGQAVHYSADFAARGYSGGSHGCVNVRDEGKIARLFDEVRTGDKVVIYW
ncbi:L,D-transpeptidase family protein [Streptomyces sp. NPDC102406]|uniref:L,D-transpeptidase family protein n=1 Tax=Streptomyces sp. NPDC102406 TaxID=3366171 RepID=UPI0038285562